MEPKKKVFISYSWTSEEHVTWITKLAERLVEDGVDVVFDRWTLDPGADKYVFMERMVKDDSIDKVLIVCDERYAERADGREGGVGTETQIISKDIYEEVDQDKFIPIIAERTEDGFPLPIFLQNRIYIDLSDPRDFYKGYEELLRQIYDQPLLEKPELGEPPAFITEEGKSVPPTTHRLETFKDAVMRDKAHVAGYAEDFLDKVAEAITQLEQREEDADSVGERVRAAVERYRLCRNDFIKFMVFVARYRPEEEIIDVTREFLAGLIPLITLRGLGGADTSRDHYKFVIYELFLYAIALLVRRQKFALAALFLDGVYLAQSNVLGASKNESYDWTIFRAYLRSFDRPPFNQTKHYQGRLLHEGNEEVDKLSFYELASVDYALFLRYGLSQREHYRTWFPYGVAVLQSKHNALPLFRRAESERYFRKLKLLLGVRDKQDLSDRFHDLCDTNPFDFSFLWGKPCVRHAQLMNLEKLATV